MESSEQKDIKLRLSRLEEENSRLKTIVQESQTSLIQLKASVDRFAQQALTVYGTEEGLKQEVERLIKLVDGDDRLEITGLRKDTKQLKAEVAQLMEDKKAIVNQVKGARLLAASLGLTVGGSIGFIVGLLGG